jgi:hypothetical protein
MNGKQEERFRHDHKTDQNIPQSDRMAGDRLVIGDPSNFSEPLSHERPCSPIEGFLILASGHWYRTTSLYGIIGRSDVSRFPRMVTILNLLTRQILVQITTDAISNPSSDHCSLHCLRFWTKSSWRLPPMPSQIPFPNVSNSDCRPS